jgi:hypothetical protein
VHFGLHFFALRLQPCLRLALKGDHSVGLSFAGGEGSGLGLRLHLTVYAGRLLLVGLAVGVACLDWAFLVEERVVPVTVY